MRFEDKSKGGLLTDAGAMRALLNGDAVQNDEVWAKDIDLRLHLDKRTGQLFNDMGDASGGFFILARDVFGVAGRRWRIYDGPKKTKKT